MIITGILLEVLAAALGTTSKQLIAFSEHVQKRWIFHVGAGINIFVGPVVDASAYAFAPQVVIAPFACLDVIFNALIAPYTLHWQHEQLTWVHMAGTGLVATGAIFTAVFGSVTDAVLSVEEIEAQLLRPASIIYLSLEVIAIVAINVCLKRRWLSATLRGISLGAIAGVLMGNVFCVKGFIGIVRRSITKGELHAWARPTPYLLVGTAAGGAVLGHLYMRKGLGEYKGVFFVTIFEGAHITAACLSGCVVMSEMASASRSQFVSYWCSVALILFGMQLFQRSKASYEIESPAHVEKEVDDFAMENMANGVVENIGSNDTKITKDGSPMMKSEEPELTQVANWRKGSHRAFGRGRCCCRRRRGDSSDHSIFTAGATSGTELVVLPSPLMPQRDVKMA